MSERRPPVPPHDPENQEAVMGSPISMPVRLSATGNFAGPEWGPLLVITNGAANIRLFQIDPATSILTQIAESYLGTLILGLECLRFSQNSPKDFIILALDGGTVVILEYDYATVTFKVVDHETYLHSSGFWMSWGRSLVSDWRLRCILIGSVEDNKIVYILNSSTPGNPGETPKLNVALPMLETYHDSVFYSIVSVESYWSNPVFACIEAHPLGSGSANSTESSKMNTTAQSIMINENSCVPREFEKLLVFFELDINSNRVFRRFQQIVPQTSNLVIPVPGRALKDAGGVLLCSANKITWISENSVSQSVCIPRNRYADSNVEIFICAYTVLRLSTESILLVQSIFGDLYCVEFLEGVLQIVFFDNISKADQLFFVNNRFLISGLIYTPCEVYYLLNVFDDEKDQPRYLSSNFTPTKTSVFLPHPLKHLKLILGSNKEEEADNNDEAANASKKSAADSPLAIAKKRVVDLEKRKMTVRELMQTEKNFSEALDIFLHKIQVEIKDQNLAFSIFYRDVFRSYPELYKFSKGFAEALEKVVEAWDVEESEIGPVFISFKAGFDNFIQVVKNYSRSMELIKDALKLDCFIAYNDMCKNSSEYGKREISEFLILPVQRAMRYTLLLRDIIKRTPAGHPDHPYLNESLEFLGLTAKKVNDIKAQEEEQTRLFQIQHDVHKCPAVIVKFSRFVVLDLSVVEVHSSKSMRLILMSDLLLLAKIKKKKHKYVFVRLINVCDITSSSFVTPLIYPPDFGASLISALRDPSNMLHGGVNAAAEYGQPIASSSNAAETGNEEHRSVTIEIDPGSISANSPSLTRSNAQTCPLNHRFILETDLLAAKLHYGLLHLLEKCRESKAKDVPVSSVNIPKTATSRLSLSSGSQKKKLTTAASQIVSSGLNTGVAKEDQENDDAKTEPRRSGKLSSLISRTPSTEKK